MKKQRIEEIDRIVSSNEFWTLGSGDHMNMIDDCLMYIELLEQRINHLAWSNAKRRQQREKYKEYNQNFLKLLRTQFSIVNVIELINARNEAEKQGKRFEW
jgi:hypothetical protein